MSFLEKLRKKPERTKKKILWFIVFFAGFILVILWILQLKYNLPAIDFSNFPKPNINQEDFKESQEGIKEFEKKIQDNVEGLKNETKNSKNK